LGIAGVLPTEQIIAEGDNAVTIASTALFGSLASTILTGFVVISCLGTLNGLVLSCIRIPYSLAIRNHGPWPKQLSKINPKTQMPINSTYFAAALSSAYLLLWYFSINETFGTYIALDEIPIVLVYGLYVFLYIWYMRNFKDLSKFNRFGKPTIAILGSFIILYGGITNPSIGIYLVVSICVLLLGLLFYRKKKL
jgi:APA family basic amino acid/polyamine antiporter